MTDEIRFMHVSADECKLKNIIKENIKDVIEKANKYGYRPCNVMSLVYLEHDSRFRDVCACCKDVNSGLCLENEEYNMGFRYNVRIWI